MALLNKLQYKQLLSSGASQKVTASDAQIDRVLKYATKLFPTLDLKARNLTQKDISAVYQFGTRTLFHVRVYPRKQPDTFLIVVTDEKEKPTDHILIDIAAEYAEKHLDAPQFGFFESATKKDIRRVITGIDPDEDNPFAILAIAEGGTYIQTYREPDGFLLEHQLVNTSSHYRVDELLSAEQVVDAMISYAFGKDEWLEAFKWQHAKLD
ncbi:MAG: hypothetical protein SFV81_14530 [Pirellulaceae bacterium]|nr:hypothetical protein [Pirellulaceae bacterium]